MIEILKNIFHDVNFNINFFLHCLILFTFLTLLFKFEIAKMSIANFNHEINNALSHVIKSNLKELRQMDFKFKMMIYAKNNIINQILFELIKKPMDIKKINMLIQQLNLPITDLNNVLDNITDEIISTQNIIKNSVNILSLKGNNMIKLLDELNKYPINSNKIKKIIRQLNNPNNNIDTLNEKLYNSIIISLSNLNNKGTDIQKLIKELSNNKISSEKLFNIISVTVLTSNIIDPLTFITKNNSSVNVQNDIRKSLIVLQNKSIDLEKLMSEFINTNVSSDKIIELVNIPALDEETGKKLRILNNKLVDNIFNMEDKVKMLFNDNIEGIKNNLKEKYSQPYDLTVNNNKNLFNSLLIINILLWTAFIIIVLILKFGCNSNLHIGTIIIENLIVFSIVGLIEFMFFDKIISKFIPVMPSFISSFGLDTIKTYFI